MFDDLLPYLAGGLLLCAIVAFGVLRYRGSQRQRSAAPLVHRVEPKPEASSASTADEKPARLSDLHAQHLEAAARIREQREAARAAREAKRLAVEEAARREAERLAAEEVIRREAQRIAAEELARREALRVAAEEAVRLEALRIAAEAEASREAQRLAAAAEEAVRLEAQRIAAEEKAAREAQRIAAVEEARREVQRIAAEEKMRQEALRAAAEEKARDEAQRAAAQAEAEREAQRIAAEQEARAQAQRIAQEEAARLEAQRVAAQAQAARDAEQAAAAAAEQERQHAAQSATKPAVQKLPAETKVMIVDDSKVGRIKTNRFLLNNQYQSQMAEDGCDALEKINANMPDIVITDVEMPNMDGFELTKHIRSNPATAHIPVIVISGNNDGYEEKAKEVGADLILGKPYSEENMLAQVQYFLRNGRAAVHA